MKEGIKWKQSKDESKHSDRREEGRTKRHYKNEQHSLSPKRVRLKAIN